MNSLSKLLIFLSSAFQLILTMANMTLIERINAVLDGRKIYPWAHSLGLSSGVVDFMKKDTLPGGEILALICRVENVSFSWLSTGKGRPFLPGKSASPEEFAERLEMHLDDSAEWQVSLLLLEEKPGMAIVIFQMPGAVVYKGTDVPYTIMEVECGPWSQDAANMLAGSKHLICYNITHAQKADAFEFIQIWEGLVGTWHITHWLPRLRPCDAKIMSARAVFRQENEGAHATELDPRRLRDVIRAVKATHQYNSMTDEQFSTVCAAVFRRLPASGEIDPNLVLVAIDSVLLQD